METKGILNSCPLTFVYEEIIEPSLTPANLIIGRRILDKTPVSIGNALKSDRETLTKRARYFKISSKQNIYRRYVNTTR